MRRINLLPPEERRRPLALPETPGGPMGLLFVAGALVLALLVGAYVVYLVRLGNEEEQISSLNRQIVELEQRQEALAPFGELQDRLAAKEPVANGIYRSRFPWDRFLQGLAFVIPPSTALESFAAEAAPIDLDAPTDRPLLPPGAVTFAGVAEPDYQNVADFVVSMNSLRYLANSTLNFAELDRETYVQPALNFEVSSELITEVGRDGTRVPVTGPEELPQENTEDQARVSPGDGP